MRNRLWAVLFLVALAGTAWWGYTQNQERNRLMITAENQYERAFYEMSYHVDQIDDALAKSMVSNSRAMVTRNIADVATQANQVKEDLSQLPLRDIRTENTQRFFANISDFFQALGQKKLSGKPPLQSNEFAAVQRTHQEMSGLKNQLAAIRQGLEKAQQPWMNLKPSAGVPVATAADNVHPIVNGFNQLETVTGRFPNLETSKVLAYGQIAPQLSGPKISRSEAQRQANQFLRGTSGAGWKLQYAGALSGKPEKGDLPVYSFRTVDQDRPTEAIYIDISQIGGRPVWMLSDRVVPTASLSMEEATKRAVAFLQNQHFPLMQVTSVTRYDNIGLIALSPVVDQALVDPATVRVRVALDNGHIVGYEGRQYLQYYPRRTIGKPKLTATQARRSINTNAKVVRQRLVLVLNDLRQEVLTYETEVVRDNNHYLVYISATTGDEVRILRLPFAPRTTSGA